MKIYKNFLLLSIFLLGATNVTYGMQLRDAKSKKESGFWTKISFCLSSVLFPVRAIKVMREDIFGPSLPEELVGRIMGFAEAEIDPKKEFKPCEFNIDIAEDDRTERIGWLQENKVSEAGTITINVNGEKIVVLRALINGS